MATAVVGETARMSSDEDELTLGRISSPAVRTATGRDWKEWLEALDAAGAADWDHKGIVAYLEQAHPEVDSGWWRQSITVGYEQARGKREVGETADAGFQVGVQRSVAASPDELWSLLVSRPELWLGEGTVELVEGAGYEVFGEDAASGEIRVVKPGERLRLSWRPAGWAAPATVQLTLSASSSGKTALRAHLEKLPDAEAREEQRARWREALGRVADAVG